MKIFILNSARKFTGEAAHCLDLTEQLLQKGHAASLVVPLDGMLLQRTEERGLPIARRLTFPGGFRGMSSLRDFYQMRKLIVTERPDIIHCHRGHDHGLAAAATLLIMGKRPAIVRTRHRVVPTKNNAGNRWLFVRRTDAVIAVSRRAADSFGSMRSIIDDKLTTIYSSVDTKIFHPEKRSLQWRREHGLSDDQPLIGLIARLQRVKGQKQFLSAAAIVAERFPNARFLVAGTGKPHKKMKLDKMVSELGMNDRVLIKDWLPDINTITASLDIGVLASLGSEGSSRVTYEYMASGVPVIATRVGCIPEVLSDGETGLTVPPGDVSALADAMIQAVGNPDLRAHLASRALDRIEMCHSRIRWVTETETVYQEAVEGQRCRVGLLKTAKDYLSILSSGGGKRLIDG